MKGSLRLVACSICNKGIKPACTHEKTVEPHARVEPIRGPRTESREDGVHRRRRKRVEQGMGRIRRSSDQEHASSTVLHLFSIFALLHSRVDPAPTSRVGLATSFSTQLIPVMDDPSTSTVGGGEEGWRLLFVAATVIVSTLIIYVVGKPLLMSSTEVEADAQQGNAYLARKQQQQQQKQQQEQEQVKKQVTAAATSVEETENAVASSQMMDEAHTCWGCGASGNSFKACAQCVEKKLDAPCRFCSTDCLKSNWLRHKQWHAGQVERDTIQQALRAAEQNGERISVPAKRAPKRKGDGTKPGTATCQEGKESSRDDTATGQDAALQRAERQQSEREHSQLAHALAHLSAQLERENVHDRREDAEQQPPPRGAVDEDEMEERGERDEGRDDDEGHAEDRAVEEGEERIRRPLCLALRRRLTPRCGGRHNRFGGPRVYRRCDATASRFCASAYIPRRCTILGHV